MHITILLAYHIQAYGELYISPPMVRNQLYSKYCFYQVEEEYKPKCQKTIFNTIDIFSNWFIAITHIVDELSIILHRFLAVMVLLEEPWGKNLLLELIILHHRCVCRKRKISLHYASTTLSFLYLKRMIIFESLVNQSNI